MKYFREKIILADSPSRSGSVAASAVKTARSSSTADEGIYTALIVIVSVQSDGTVEEGRDFQNQNVSRS